MLNHLYLAPKLTRFWICPGQLVSAVQEPLIQSQKSVTLPDDALDLAGLFVAEYEEYILLEGATPS